MLDRPTDTPTTTDRMNHLPTEAELLEVLRTALEFRAANMCRGAAPARTGALDSPSPAGLS